MMRRKLQRGRVISMNDTAARRLASMLTESQRRDMLQLAQIIGVPADVTPANVPESGTSSKNPARG